MPGSFALLDNPKYKVQVIYTKIDRDKNNKPSFTDYKYHATKNYVYPASTVKLPVSLLALIKIGEIGKITRSTPMLTDSAYYCQKKITRDTSSESKYPTIENYIRKMFLVSDNSACARVYEFVGHDYAHNKLEKIGYKNIRLFNRLDGSCPGDTAKVTPPVYFLGANNDTIYSQRLTYFNDTLKHPVESSKVGKIKTAGGYTPKDFSAHNYLTPSDLHSIMKRIVFNDDVEKNKLPISSDDRRFMLKYLGMYPKESEYPKYDKKIYYDSFKKYFIYGSAVATIKQDSLRIFNIVGRAYGFLVDCAYIVDFKNNIEYLLTASIYVNDKNIIGSGKYEYDQLGLPFLKNLSLSIYDYERHRERTHPPDLGEYKSLLEKR